MKRVLRVRSVLLLAVVVGVAMSFTGMKKAEARPNYLAVFKKKYGEKVKEKMTCAVCHPEKSKKVKNDYGKAVGGALGMPKVKDKEKIGGAMDAAGKKPSSTEGKTFGDLIDSGKLPS